jgi:adenosine deaminase
VKFELEIPDNLPDNLIQTLRNIVNNKVEDYQEKIKLEKPLQDYLQSKYPKDKVYVNVDTSDFYTKTSITFDGVFQTDAIDFMSRLIVNDLFHEVLSYYEGGDDRYTCHLIKTDGIESLEDVKKIFGD